MARRLKDYRTRNPDDSGNTVKDFFLDACGYQNVLVIDSMSPETEQLPKMQEIIEQKGKPCCINMISADDKKFLANLEKMAQKEIRAKQRAEKAAALAAEQEANPAASGEEGEQKEEETQDVSEEEVDELTVMIQNQEQEAQKRQQEEEQARKQKAIEEEQSRAKEAKESAKLEKLREQERDLLDQRSQPIR